MALEDDHFVPLTHGALSLLGGAAADAATAATVLAGDDVRLGSRAATAGVARADLLEAELQRLWDAVARLNAAIPGGASHPQLPVWPATVAAASVGSTTVKVN